jgi:flagellar assembly factor FliW
MLTTCTRFFGELQYSEESVLTFPSGLLGFELHKRFLLIERPASRPLSFLQNLDDPSLCFPVMPALQADPSFQVALDEQSCSLLELPFLNEPFSPESLLVLAIISFDEIEPPAANLKGPVVIHVAARKAVQVVQFDVERVLRHPVPALDEVLSCW